MGLKEESCSKTAVYKSKLLIENSKISRKTVTYKASRNKHKLCFTYKFVKAKIPVSKRSIYFTYMSYGERHVYKNSC